MNIRKANLSDINQLSVLFNEYRIFYKKKSDLIGAKKFLTDRINTKESMVYVCEYDPGRLAGFVQLYPIFSSTRMKRLWLLNDLYVHPDFRGQKVSVHLIDAAKELAMASNSCGLMLETDKTNSIGNSLYPKTEFVLNKKSNFYSWDI